MAYAPSRVTVRALQPLANSFASIFRSDRKFSNHSLLLGKSSASRNRYGHQFWPISSKMNHPVGRSWTSAANLNYDAASKNQYSNVHQQLPPQTAFDICQGREKFPTSTKTLFEKNEEQGSEMCDSRALNPVVLKPGMILLKEYLTLEEQVWIVRECRRLGLGQGGFYRVNQRRMLMCLGLDWDPKTSKYNKVRRLDKVRVPNIPHEFLPMVNRSMLASRACMEKEYGAENVEGLLPMMKPDVCLLNFYSSGGRLGLHQDRDESRDSLVEGIPIVSFSVGDSGEFYYGDERDINEAKKVVLESGDVLIFGGPAQHIFHGVQSIIPSSAPEFLLKETGLRPGRLNLTFRQF